MLTCSVSTCGNSSHIWEKAGRIWRPFTCVNGNFGWKLSFNRMSYHFWNCPVHMWHYFICCLMFTCLWENNQSHVKMWKFTREEWKWDFVCHVEILMWEEKVHKWKYGICSFQFMWHFCSSHMLKSHFTCVNIHFTYDIVIFTCKNSTFKCDIFIKVS